MNPFVLLVAVLLPVPLFVFWLWMFRDMTNNDYLSSGERNNWTLYFVFLNVFAAFWYYMAEYRPRHM